MQDCPAYEKPPAAQRFAAYSKSVSSWMITPALPPSSRSTFFFPALPFKYQPTFALPVNESSLNRSSVTIFSAKSLAQGRMLTAPDGSPDWAITSASINAVIGVWGAGFKTIGLPEAIAG